jgi:hypothetical protein
MVRKAFEILRGRWPEVMLVVVWQAALMIFISQTGTSFEETSPTEAARLPFWTEFLLGFGGILCIIIWTMLYLGFLKTAAVEGAYPQQPVDLLRRGRLYFWKIFLFQLLLAVVLWIFSGVVIYLSAGLIWKTQDAAMIPEWFIVVCTLAAVLIFMKPALFIPARIIVYDDSVIQATLAMRQYRLRDVDCLYGLIAGLVGIAAVFMLLSGLVTDRMVLYYIMSGIGYLILSLMSLWLTLAVVLWVQNQLEAVQAQEKERMSQE